MPSGLSDFKKMKSAIIDSKSIQFWIFHIIASGFFLDHFQNIMGAEQTEPQSLEFALSPFRVFCG